jgi:hypothetical protein
MVSRHGTDPARRQHAGMRSGRGASMTSGFKLRWDASPRMIICCSCATSIGRPFERSACGSAAPRWPARRAITAHWELATAPTIIRPGIRWRAGSTARRRRRRRGLRWLRRLCRRRRRGRVTVDRATSTPCAIGPICAPGSPSAASRAACSAIPRLVARRSTSACRAARRRCSRLWQAGVRWGCDLVLRRSAAGGDPAMRLADDHPEAGDQGCQAAASSRSRFMCARPAS